MNGQMTYRRNHLRRRNAQNEPYNYLSSVENFLEKPRVRMFFNDECNGAKLCQSLCIELKPTEIIEYGIFRPGSMHLIHAIDGASSPLPLLYIFFFVCTL